MYLVAIDIPTFVAGDKLFIATDWKRSLELLRDSLEGRYGSITVVSTKASYEGSAGLVLSPVTNADDIVLVPTVPAHTRIRSYWSGARAQWITAVAEQVRSCSVLHTAIGDSLRPFGMEAWQQARGKVPCVVVQDTNCTDQYRESAKLEPKLLAKSLLLLGSPLWDRYCSMMVADAALSLLKYGRTYDAYRTKSKNAVPFHDTSFNASDVISLEDLRERQATRKTKRIRLVHFGRLVAYKGVPRSIALVIELRKLGLDVTLDVYGDGDERPAVCALGEQLGPEAFRWHGSRQYSPQFLHELRQYDGFLFTPKTEDTPRAIFDGFSAGLPLVALEIPYVQAVAAQTGAVLPLGNLPAQLLAVELAPHIASGAGPGTELARLAEAARVAALQNTCEYWYELRAQRTHEAVERWRGKS